MRLKGTFKILSALAMFTPAWCMATTLTPTSEQTARLEALLDKAPRVRGQMEEAHELIVRTITTSACATSAASFNELNDAMVSPRKWGTLINSEGYVGEFFHHNDEPRCLDVMWVRPRRISAREIAVNVRYASGEDHRYVHQSLYFRHMRDGQWRISAIGDVLDNGL